MHSDSPRFKQAEQHIYEPPPVEQQQIYYQGMRDGLVVSVLMMVAISAVVVAVAWLT